MGYGLLNVGSVVLGLMAWAVPVWYIGRLTKGGKRWYGWTGLISMGCCGSALWMQLWYHSHLADIQDWSAIMDTSGAVVKVAVFLLVTTCLLNVAALKMDQALEEEEKT